ncbi:MAG: DUF4249 domain-containing protein [Muribaculaceae bacterium]|nr:DUF4249 domain-containing protein [Muribaculaceae bacterium]
MKRGIYHILIILQILLTGSCKKEIDMDYHDIEPITVIEGQLSQNGVEVRITMTTPMDEPMDTKLLTDATVVLSNLTTGEEEYLNPDDRGVFKSDRPGIAGNEYELQVNRGGKRYTSRCTMPDAPELLALEFNWIKMPYDHVAVLQVTFTENAGETGECYWVRLYRNGEAYMWNLVTDIYASDGIINDVFMTSRKNLDEEDDATALHDGDIVSASVSPISRKMYDYLEAVSSDSNGPQLFEGDFCLGYFLATSVVESSVIFHPDEIAIY